MNLLRTTVIERKREMRERRREREWRKMGVNQANLYLQNSYI